MSKKDFTIIFNLRGKIIKLKPEDIPQENWYIYNLVNDTIDDGKDIYINEDYNSFMSLFESIRYNNLVLFNGVSLEHLLLLGQKWCVPEWLLDDIKSRITLNSEQSEKILRCINCKEGYKQSENLSHSCTFHPGDYCTIHNKFKCCGTNTPYCRISYHFSYK